MLTPDGCTPIHSFAQPVLPLPYPRHHTPLSCPKRPGKQPWPDTVRFEDGLGLDFLVPKAVLTSDTSRLVDQAVVRATARGDVPARFPSPVLQFDLECHLIAETRWSNKTGSSFRGIVSPTLTLYPRIRYAFAVTLDQGITQVGMFRQYKFPAEVKPPLWQFSPKSDAEVLLKPALATSAAVVEFVLKEQQEVTFLLRTPTAWDRTSGTMALFHLGP